MVQDGTLCYTEEPFLIQHHHGAKSILGCQLRTINLPCQFPSRYCAFCCILLNFIPHCPELSLCPCFFFVSFSFFYNENTHRHESYNCLACGTCPPSVLISAHFTSSKTTEQVSVKLNNVKILPWTYMFLTDPPKNILDQLIGCFLYQLISLMSGTCWFNPQFNSLIRSVADLSSEYKLW